MAKSYTANELSPNIYHVRTPLYVAPISIPEDKIGQTKKITKEPEEVPNERKNCKECGGTGKNPNYTSSLFSSWNCQGCNVGGKSLLLCEVRALDDSTNEGKGRCLFYRPAGIWILIPKEMGLETIQEMNDYAKDLFENTTVEDLQREAKQYYSKFERS